MEEVLLPQVHHKFLLWEGCNKDAKCRVREAESEEEIFTSVAWIRALNINEPIYAELFYEFYSTNEFDEGLDITTFRDLFDSDGKLIPKDPKPRVPRVGIHRPSRASMQDLYDRMGQMEIRQEVIEHIEYRQLYHWDRYHGAFEHMAGVYSVLLQGAYNPPSYAQPQYEQYYQQYL
nr:hypothetical protein [Tanacetum cinerariifolium]